VRTSTPAFEVETFEYVDAGPGVALLRLSGTWGADAPLDDVELVAVAGGQRVALAPLPTPGADDGSWRAAYSASPELLSDPDATFELEPADGDPIQLPAPVEHGAAVAVEPEAEVEPEPEPQQKPEPRRAPEPHAPAVARLFGRRRHAHTPAAELAHLREAIAAEREARQVAESTAAEERARAQRAEALLADELRNTVGKTEELIDRIDGYEHGRISFEQELDAVRRTHAGLLAEAREEHALELAGLRDELDAARRELASALEDLESMKEHVDTLHEAQSLDLGAARSQRDSAEKRLASLKQRLADSDADAEALNTELDAREDLIQRARAEAAQGADEAADLHAAVVRLRDAIAVRARDVATARRRAGRSPQALDRTRDELRRDSERIAELEQQAEALRDAIHSQLPYSLHPSPLQEALPLGEGAEVQSEA
jgi:hypothetical protein